MTNAVIPQTHRVNNEKLVSDGYVYLFEIELNNGSYLYFKENNSVNWQGKTWTGIPLSFEGYSSASGETLSRPTLSVANPEGSFSTFIRDGHLIRSVIKRYAVLYSDILNNNNVYQVKTWLVWNVPQMTKDMIQLELRNPMDGVNFNIPARAYMPPEFPSVSLK